MFFTDFEYDGIRLSDYGYMVCTFDGGSMTTVENGSQLTFNTVPIKNGELNLLTGTNYSSSIEANFQICKIDTQFSREDMVFSEDEIREMMRWLNRKQYHKFRILDQDYYDWYYEGSFNISKIEIGARVCALDLTFMSNQPFARQEQQTHSFTVSANGAVTIPGLSDEEGYIYPDMKIIILQDGDLSIQNAADGRNTYIANCERSETITISHPIISTSSATHKIQNDFNWKFLRLVNSFGSTDNALTFSLPCEVTITYSPIVKMGI